MVQVEIKKSRFQVNDEYILSVGLFKARSRGTTANVYAANQDDEADGLDGADEDEVDGDGADDGVDEGADDGAEEGADEATDAIGAEEAPLGEDEDGETDDGAAAGAVAADGAIDDAIDELVATPTVASKARA
jgi:hypothetical protein